MSSQAKSERERIRALRELIYSRAPESKFRPASAASLESLRAQFPTLPDHLFELMAQVGEGTIGDSRYSIYFPMEPDFLYHEEFASELAGLVVVGDDFAGFRAAYDTRGEQWKFGEISSRVRFRQD